MSHEEAAAFVSSRLDTDPPAAVELTDQTRLPDEVVLVRCGSDEQLAAAIADLRVRGAPAIGVAAARGVAAAALRAAQAGADAAGVRAAVERSAALLGPVRPTAVNLAWACTRMVAAARAAAADTGTALAQALVAEAEATAAQEREACDRIGRHGADLLEQLVTRDRLRLQTHCNTGPLCTGGTGTAFAIVTELRDRGRLEQLWIDETRPLLQGARITAWEAQQLAIPHAVLVDAAAAALLGAGEVDAVVVGADRVAANGDVANKIGTYGLAVLAHHHEVPFLVAAPTSTLDAEVSSGDAIEVEQRPATEVRQARGVTPLTPPDSPVHNPAFDVTPARLVSALVTDRGVVRPVTAEAIAAHLGASG